MPGRTRSGSHRGKLNNPHDANSKERTPLEVEEGGHVGTPRGGQWQLHPEAWSTRPRDIPYKPVPYTGPPSPGCAPAADCTADGRGGGHAWPTFAMAAGMAWGDKVVLEDKSKEAQARCEAGITTAALLDQRASCISEVEGKAAGPSCRPAAAPETEERDADWQGERWGAEPAFRISLDNDTDE